MTPAGSHSELRRPKILLSAGEWGFGPIVTAEMIARRILPFADIDLLAFNVAATYAYESSVLAPISRQSLDSLKGEYDLVISVLEPAAVVWAFQHNTRAVSVDNIYWHWRWSNEIATRARALLETSPSTVEATLAALKALGSYAEYTVLYLAATHVFWQRMGPSAPGIPPELQARVVQIDPLLRESRPATKRPQLLLSLSGGLLNPMSNERHWTIYLNVLAQITARGLAVAREAGWEVVVVAPSQLLERVSDALGLEAKAFGHDAFLEVLAESSVIAAPKGLSTTVETVASGTALFTLPELHDGNATNYWGLAEAIGCTPTEFSLTFPAAQISESPEDAATVASLYQGYERELTTGGAFLPRAADSFATFVEACVVEDTRLVIAAQQHTALLRAVHGFDGLNQLVNLLRDTLTTSQKSAHSIEGRDPL